MNHLAVLLCLSFRPRLIQIIQWLLYANMQFCQSLPNRGLIRNHGVPASSRIDLRACDERLRYLASAMVLAMSSGMTPGDSIFFFS